MFNACPNCGMYSEEKLIDPSGPFAICPHCHYAHPFLQQPLFIITGASGTGKSTVCLSLTSLLKECVVLEQDILWGVVPATSEDNYSDYRNVWLRVAKNVGQAGRPVVLCGTALPEQFEECPERRYFSTLHYLTFVCDDDTLEERLKQRPGWRKSHTPEFLKNMLQFNKWLKANASLTKPPMTLFDTSNRSIDETVEYVAEWVRQRL
ncbi:MAG TPA: AAA family ATPase [Ktedonobacteraceae bacterium]|nr:AAA family ATPase [Ktedonobacteraceae bacterium]